MQFYIGESLKSNESAKHILQHDNEKIFYDT